MYRSMKPVFVLSCGLLVAGFLTSAKADVWNKKTVITFQEPVEVPGAVLEPGQYVMKLVDSSSNRHIVQFMNANENHVYSTVLAIPNSRPDPADNTVLSFYEMPAGKPQALRAWFYPGDTIGQEFAYPKERATQIARVTDFAVPTLPSESETAAESSEGGNAPAEAESSAAATAPASTAESSATPEEESVAVAENSAYAAEPSQAPAAQTRPATESASESERLPHTAGELPLLALLGVCSLGLAATLRFLSKRNPIG